MEKRFLGIKEMSEYMGVRENTLYAWVYQKKIPYTKIGKLVKFDLQKIESWLQQKSVKPIHWD